MPWDEALQGISSKLESILAEHGPRSVGLYLGNPNAFNALGSASGMFFSAVLGTDRVNVLAPMGPGTFDPVSCMSQVTGIPVDVRPVAQVMP